MVFYFIAHDSEKSWAMFFMLWGLFKNNVRNENFYVKNLYFLIEKVHIFALEMNFILLKRVRVGWLTKNVVSEM